MMFEVHYLWKFPLNSLQSPMANFYDMVFKIKINCKLIRKMLKVLKVLKYLC